MTRIPDKNVKQLLKRYPGLVVSRLKRHLRISLPDSKACVIAPISGSDWRGLLNLERDIRYLMNSCNYGGRKRMP